MIVRLVLCVSFFACIASSTLFEKHEHADHSEPNNLEPEMRVKWNKQKRNLCKTYEFLACLPKRKCPKENRRTEKLCVNKDNTCCARCENLEGYGCKPKSQCPKGSVKGSFFCPKKGHQCCKLTKVDYNQKCEEEWQCAEGSQFCNLKTKRCDCQKGYVPQGGKCVEACGTFGKYSGYKLMVYPKQVTRDEAVVTCKYEGARLPVVKDSSMSAAIDSAMSDAVSNGADMTDSDSMWLGLMPTKTPFTHIWEDKTNLVVNPADGTATDGSSYTNFNTGRSYDNALGEGCYILLGGDHVWEDIDCGVKGKVRTVCECIPTDELS